MLKRTEDLLEMRKTRKVAALLWCAQVDAAAKVDAEVDGGGRAPKLGDVRKTKHMGTKGKKEMTLRSYL